MKTLLLAITFGFMCLTSYAQPVKKHGRLHVAGGKMLDEKGQPVALHGMSFGWHNLWPRFYNAGAVHELVTGWNATLLRAAMGIQLNDKGYLKSPEESIRLMKNVIDACITEGIYIIIDWHDHNIHPAEAKQFFSLMAKQYSRYPNIIYEVYNEPDQETWPEVKSYAEEVIKSIRTYDTSNIILVGCPKWDQDINLPAANPIQNVSNLMYTMHFYAGTHKQWLRDRTDSAMQKGLPVFISECAATEASGDGIIDVAEWQRWADWMDSKGLSCALWSVSDKAETCSVLTPAAASNGKWKEDQIKEWGKLAKDYLKKSKK